jgi:uncharacterized protein (TIGR02145 family)
MNRILIGKQIWSDKNLDVVTFTNGDSILCAQNSSDWIYAGENKIPAYCNLDYENPYGLILGKLYNWYAVNDKRGLVPNGWKIPENNDWEILANFLGGASIAGKKMKSPFLWKSLNEENDIDEDLIEVDLINSSGFSGLPTSARNENGLFFGKSDTISGYWSMSENGTESAWTRDLYYATNFLGIHSLPKSTGASIRCLLI